MNKKVLVFAAHPDDEILGCGGTINMLLKEGHSIFTCVITDGETARKPQNSINAIKRKKEECLKANKLIGVKEVIFLGLPDMKLDVISHADLNNAIEKVINKIQPSIIFTHSSIDLNNDHILTFHATMVACRPEKRFLKKIFEYEVLSSTEWSHLGTFNPNVYINLEQSALNRKIKAFKIYRNEIRKYPHSRSEEGIITLAKYRGMQAGQSYSEAFRLIRSREL